MPAGSPSPPRLGPADVGTLTRDVFPVERFIVVSNREPYEHRWSEESGTLEVQRPPGGVTSALDPLLQALGGVWIAWGSGEGDRAASDEQGRVRVPPEAPRYTLRRLWLDERDIQHYYLGYANQVLWPLCHLRPAMTRVRARYWARYRAVNHRFAEAVLEEAGDGPAAVWFHDYHLALAPAHARRRRPDLKLAQFWHIPWPPLEIFRAASQAPELLQGLLANDLLAFHLPSFVSHFLDCAEAIVGARVDRQAGSVTLGGRVCHVRSFPISVDVDAFAAAASRPGIEKQIARLRARLTPRGSLLGLGVDRLDYTKGLEEKLKALEFLWERNPELREQFTFVQIAAPSRTEIVRYDSLSEKVEGMAHHINDRFGTERWRPVHLMKESLPPERLAAYYRAADLCIVSSLQDGMNLVAKEYVASRPDGDGMLLLSRFAGAAAELDGMLEVNPYDPEDFAERIRDALSAGAAERRERMARMRASLRTIYDWMADNLRAWGEVTARSADPALTTPPS